MMRVLDVWRIMGSGDVHVLCDRRQADGDWVVTCETHRLGTWTGEPVGVIWMVGESPKDPGVVQRVTIMRCEELRDRLLRLEEGLRDGGA